MDTRGKLESCEAAEPDAPEQDYVIEEKTRLCLVCRSPFPSAWAGERICRRCKSSSAWRSGALR